MVWTNNILPFLDLKSLLQCLKSCGVCKKAAKECLARQKFTNVGLRRSLWTEAYVDRKTAWLVAAKIENLEADGWIPAELERYGERSPTSLKKLCLMNCRETDHAVHQLLLMAPNLLSLTFSSNSRVTQVMLQHLPRWLTELGMPHITLDDVETQLPRSLNVLTCRVNGNDNAIQHLSQLTELRRLELASPPETILRVDWMAFKDLTSLTLLHAKPDRFQSLPNSLQQLTVRVFHLTDGDLRSLMHLSQLNTLTLDGCVGLTDQGMVHLKNMPLKYVSLDSCPISNAGVETLVTGPVTRRTIMTIDVTGTMFNTSELSHPLMGWDVSLTDGSKTLSRTNKK